MKICSVYGCRNAKAKPECRTKTFFSFPLKNPELLQRWLQNIRRYGFMLDPSTNSVICSDHFQEDSFTMCLFKRRRILKRDAVPTIFTQAPKKTQSSFSLWKKALFSSESKPDGKLQTDETKQIIPVALYKSPILINAPNFNPSEPSSDQENTVDEVKIKDETLIPPEHIKKEECEQISTSQEPDKNLNLKQSDYVTIKTEKNPSEPSSAEENPEDKEKIKVETLSPIKQEKKEECEEISTPRKSDEKSNLNPKDYVTIVTERKAILLLPIVGNQVPAILAQDKPVKATVSVPSKKMLSAVSDSLENTTKKIGSKPQTVAELLKLKRHSSEELASSSSSSKKSTGHTPNATQAKICRLIKPSIISIRKDKPQPLAGTPKVVHSTLPTENDGNATREMFESLFDGSENNPLFGSITDERPGDLFDMFADYVAVKLREMDSDNCSYALRSILDILSKSGKVQPECKAPSDNSSPAPSSRPSDQK